MATQRAKELGKDAGIAVTCRLWDATPCDFCCHNIDRDKEEELVGDYPTSGVNFVFGGGAEKFANRKDGRDIFNELRVKGLLPPNATNPFPEWLFVGI